MTEQQITRVDKAEEAKWGRRIRILIDAGEHELAQLLLQEWLAIEEAAIDRKFEQA